MINDLSHIDSKNRPTMVDVSAKSETHRVATARAVVTLPEAFAVFRANTDADTAKGPVIATAIIAGTLAAKKTSDLIPFCHPLSIDSCKFRVECLTASSLEIFCTVKNRGPTGVEMEALVGVAIAAATVYDMCKALTHDITIGPIQLTEKSGGKCDFARPSLRHDQ